MGESREADSVLRILAAFSREESVLRWAINRAEDHWGKQALASTVFEFTETEYYTESMGRPLLKAFWAFEVLAAPSELASWKQETNRWEIEFSENHPTDVARPLNLDPG